MHPFLAVPLIALADACVIGAIFAVQTLVFDGFMSPLEVAKIGFVFGGIVALVVGYLLAWPFRFWGSRIPKPQAIWFTAIGAVVGFVISITTAAEGEFPFLLMMVFVASLSGYLWWYLVERARRDWDPKIA